MNNIDLDILKEQAKIYNALSHPTRLMIVHSIAQDELSVTDLANTAGIDISTMSRHLNILKQADIIIGRKVRNQMFYHLEFKCVLTFFNCIESNRKHK